MTTRIKRSNAFELTLEIKDERFIQPPREAQRSVLLNRALSEFVADLNALDKVSMNFVPGVSDVDLKDRSQGYLSDQEIMEDWQFPVMQAMADVVCHSQGDILEVGFGRGISSTMIQKHRVRSHTIIECNPTIAERFHEWKSGQSNKNIRLVLGMWQDTIDNLGLFDGIFFHTYPLNQEEYMNYVHGKVTFAQHFFATAAEHLKTNGILTYFSNEIDSLSRSHQRSLFQYFSEITIKVIPLDLPEDVKDTWWANSMVIVKAVK